MLTVSQMGWAVADNFSTTSRGKSHPIQNVGLRDLKLSPSCIHSLWLPNLLNEPIFNRLANARVDLIRPNGIHDIERIEFTQMPLHRNIFPSSNDYITKRQLYVYFNHCTHGSTIKDMGFQPFFCFFFFILPRETK